MSTLAVYYANGGDDPTTAYVPVARAKSEMSARRLLTRALREGEWGTARDYGYSGIVERERMHDHHVDDGCPGANCLGPECTYLDDADQIHGPGCPLPQPCPRPLTVHRFDLR